MDTIVTLSVRPFSLLVMYFLPFLPSSSLTSKGQHAGYDSSYSTKTGEGPKGISPCS